MHSSCRYQVRVTDNDKLTYQKIGMSRYSHTRTCMTLMMCQVRNIPCTFARCQVGTRLVTLEFASLLSGANLWLADSPVHCCTQAILPCKCWICMHRTFTEAWEGVVIAWRRMCLGFYIWKAGKMLTIVLSDPESSISFDAVHGQPDSMPAFIQSNKEFFFNLVIEALSCDPLADSPISKRN